MDGLGWNLGLVHSGVLMLIAVEFLILAGSRAGRGLGLGLIAQAIVLLFLTARAELPRSDLEIPAVAVLVVFGVWSLWTGSSLNPEPERSHSAVAPLPTEGCVEP